MATIYSDQHCALKDLLGRASENATLLIPDLQRPYVWSPSQVVALVDSLVRGWPFGTLLTWRVKPDDPARDLARPFWEVVDRTDEEDGQLIGMMHPPAPFQMVLDGQQRVQSLLLAFGGDGWGFRLLDRQWHEHLYNIKPRGPRGRPHWSLGCLCVDVPALSQAYAQTRRATAIDYATVLRWVVTDGHNGQSKLPKPNTYVEPLQKRSSSPGQFVRLARLWEKAPEQASIDPFEAEDLADTILKENDFSEQTRADHKRSTGALLIALREVKQTRVTYLELAGYEEAFGTREVYNDAVVNIFTRLNTAGRTLTREDITFAWLKIGWNTSFTQGESASACIEALVQQLDELALPITAEDVISAISFVWAVSFNSGKLLNNDDLLKGEALRPMAANVSENWSLIVEAVTAVGAHLRDRGLRFREHYQSINALAYLWAWYFCALRWRQERKLTSLESDSLEKSLRATLDGLVDRWLICSQWAGVWATVSAQTLGGFASRLAACAQDLETKSDVRAATGTLAERLQSEIKDIEQAAVNGLNAITADERQQVRFYYTALWIWNRLQSDRWAKAKLALRQQTRTQNRLDVDHIVAWDLWRSKVDDLKLSTGSGPDNLTDDDLLAKVNELGNCMLLEKNFNISKSNKPLNAFLQGVHEFKDGSLTLEEWASALDLAMPQVDSAKTPVDKLSALFAERSQKIRGDLEQFIRGNSARVDLRAD